MAFRVFRAVPSCFTSLRTYATLTVGQRESLTKVFTQKDVQQFANISEDSNPIHVDPEYAKSTRFGKTIVHGTLLAGLLSGVMGTKLPGKGAVLISYNMEFHAPAYVGESVTAEVELAKLEGRRAVFAMKCSDKNSKVLVSGEALLLIPKSANIS